MSNTSANLRHKINNASDLKGVVRTMKALAAASISQYESSVGALAHYYRTVELGLSASLRSSHSAILPISRSRAEGCNDRVSAIVFGSDQGLVGQFNEDVADFAVKTLAKLAVNPQVFVVGERISARILDRGLNIVQGFAVPTNINAITGLVRKIQIESETSGLFHENTQLYIFHNQPVTMAQYRPVSQRLLPLDRQWQHKMASMPWPTKILPEILCSSTETMGALIREYIFISLYRACAESLSSENASRLTAMQRAEKNIDEQLQNLGQEFHQLRQNSIDEELSDLLAGYELFSNCKAEK
ncbi:F0F1 ATP synthase subunit gamma [Alteromonas facilis]|uniref:F0F1 ATP synthase subunit gamma n=1 Tax=Alteromonas facilis TaxID=2048004 RepID=UPI000C28D694|nr:F0F1 ATP synthase subunit gamma [Alteromonas facilis]